MSSRHKTEKKLYTQKSLDSIKSHKIFAFPPIEKCIERISVTIHVADTSDMIQNESYTSYDDYDLDDQVFDEVPLCDDYDDHLCLIMKYSNLKFEIMIFIIPLD